MMALRIPTWEDIARFFFKIPPERRSNKDERRKVEELLNQLEAQENQIREHAEYRDALLKALPDIVFVLDRDGYYLDCYTNDELKLVYPCSVVVGKHISDCLDEKVVDECLDKFRKVLRTRMIDFVEYGLMLSGQVRYFEARLVPLDKDKVLATVRDVTEWRMAQEHLAQQLTWQQELLRRCVSGTGCPGSEDGVCLKATLLGLDTEAVDGETCGVPTVACRLQTPESGYMGQPCTGDS